MATTPKSKTLSRFPATGAYSTKPPVAAGAITAVGVNSGLEKILRHERRWTSAANAVAPYDASSPQTDAVFNGSQVSLRWCRNQLGRFAVIVEAGAAGASGVTVEVDTFVGTGGAAGSSITNTVTATGNGVADFVGRPIEILVARYVQIRGMRADSYLYAPGYDERYVPKKLRLPLLASNPTKPDTGLGWSNRPGADRFFPEPLVPIETYLEKHGSVDIPPLSSQTFYVRVFVPKTLTAGTYTSTVRVKRAGDTVWSRPVSLVVEPVTLPDYPAMPTLLNVDDSLMAGAYTGAYYPGASGAAKRIRVAKNAYKLAHRLGLECAAGLDMDDGAGWPFRPTSPPNDYPLVLNGTLFTSANGYDGPGINTPNRPVWVGMGYGHWRDWCFLDTEARIQSAMDGYQAWRVANSPNITPAVWVTDEPHAAGAGAIAQANTWIGWMKGAGYTGDGKVLPAMVTQPLQHYAELPSCDWIIHPSGYYAGTQAATDVAAYLASGGTRLFSYYNHKAPATASAALEEDLPGQALILLAHWRDRKAGRQNAPYMIWATCFWVDTYGGTGARNVFVEANTILNDDPTQHPPTPNAANAAAAAALYGRAATNGDGVWFYPGTQTAYPADNYDVEAIFSGMKLEALSFGSFLCSIAELAYAKNSVSTLAAVDALVTAPTLTYQAAAGTAFWTTDPDLILSKLGDLIDIAKS